MYESDTICWQRKKHTLTVYTNGVPIFSRSSQFILFKLNINMYLFSIMAACANFNINFKLLDHLQCALCLDIYDDPKCLVCLHSFCKTCIDETLQFNNDGSATIDCPQCKKQTFIDANKTTNDLLANFQIKGIVDAYNTNNIR